MTGPICVQIYMTYNSYTDQVRINNKCVSFLRIYTRIPYVKSNKYNVRLRYFSITLPMPF